ETRLVYSGIIMSTVKALVLLAEYEQFTPLIFVQQIFFVDKNQSLIGFIASARAPCRIMRKIGQAALAFQIISDSRLASIMTTRQQYESIPSSSCCHTSPFQFPE